MGHAWAGSLARPPRRGLTLKATEAELFAKSVGNESRPRSGRKGAISLVNGPAPLTNNARNPNRLLIRLRSSARQLGC